MLLGVDAGGTSTRAVLVDEGGRCRGYGAAGGGNPISWGPQRAASAIATAASAALTQAGDVVLTGPAVLAMAGGSGFSDTGPIEAALRRGGLAGRVTVASDLLATFCAGTPERDGYAVVAGTGAAAIRVRDGVVDASADGLGWLLGDGGSGFWIGHRVVRAALAALDGRGPETVLAALVLAELGLAEGGCRAASARPAVLQAAVDALYRLRPVELSRFATLAFRAAEVTEQPAADRPVTGQPVADQPVTGQPEMTDGVGPAAGAGDPVAAGILTAARERLVATLGAVHRSAVAGPVVLGGGIARRLAGLADAIGRAVTGDQPVLTVADGAAGAAVLALRHAGLTVDRAAFDTLTASLAKRRAGR